MNDAITPFTLAFPQADLEELNRRIDQTRWPDAETVGDWTQGAPLAKVKALVDHWRHRYDWPGSVIEFMKIIGPLTDPTAHGGRPEDALIRC